MKKFLLTVALLVAVAPVYAHQPWVHQYIVQEAYRYLEQHIGAIPELKEDLDRHILISAGGGYCVYTSDFTTREGSLVMVGLELPLDKDRDWNIELIYGRFFWNNSPTTNDFGFLSFRRYLISQEYDIRPSFHIGLGSGVLSLDIGVGIDFTIIKRLLYSQLCVRTPYTVLYGHSSGNGMPRMITLSARIML